MARALTLKVGNPLRKLVLLKLCDNANDEGVCWPSQATLAEHCEISKRSVINHIKALEEANFLTTHHSVKNNKKQVNRYQIHLEKSQIGSAGDAPLSSAGDSLPSAGDSLPSSAVDSHRTCQSYEPVNEDKKNKQKKPTETDALDWSEINLTEQQKNDVLNLRKAAKAKLTQRALTAIARELNKATQAGISVDESIDIWALRGWKSFTAHWAIKHKFGDDHGNHHANTAQPSAEKFSADTVFSHGRKFHAGAGRDPGATHIREINPEIRDRIHEPVSINGELRRSGHGLGQGDYRGGCDLEGAEAWVGSVEDAQTCEWSGESIPAEPSGVSGSLSVGKPVGGAEPAHAGASVSPSVQRTAPMAGSPSSDPVLDCA